MQTVIIVMEDIKARVFTQPEMWGQPEAAMRGFEDRCREEGSKDIVSRHPDHFRLWLIGHYDDSTGKIEIYEGNMRTMLADGAQYKFRAPTTGLPDLQS